MSEHDETAAPRSGWIAVLGGVLKTTAAFTLIGPLVQAMVYIVAMVILDLAIGRAIGMLDETPISFVQAVYSYGAAPAALIGAVIGVWRAWRGSASWLFAVAIALPIGFANIVYQLRTDPSTQPSDLPLAMLGTMHAITWAAAVSLTWAIIAWAGRPWLLIRKGASA
jgi:hypothetical protein